MGSTSWLAAWRDGVTTTRSGRCATTSSTEKPSRPPTSGWFSTSRRIARIGFDADDAVGEAERRHHLGVRGEDRHDALRRRGHGDAAVEGVADRDRFGLRNGAARHWRGKRHARHGGRAVLHQNLTWKPAMTSRPGIELPQAPFWLARLAVHGVESRR